MLNQPAQSKLLQRSDDLDANAYAEVMNDELRQLMDCHVPIMHKVKRRGKNDCRWLSTVGGYRRKPEQPNNFDDV